MQLEQILTTKISGVEFSKWNATIPHHHPKNNKQNKTKQKKLRKV